MRLRSNNCDVCWGLEYLVAVVSTPLIHRQHTPVVNEKHSVGVICGEGGLRTDEGDRMRKISDNTEKVAIV